MPNPPVFYLNSGQKMPQIGLGIHQVTEEELRPAIHTALEAGYRSGSQVQQLSMKQFVQGVNRQRIPFSRKLLSKKIFAKGEH